MWIIDVWEIQGSLSSDGLNQVGQAFYAQAFFAKIVEFPIGK